PASVSQGSLALVVKSKVQVLALSGEGTLPRADITKTVSLEIARGASDLVTVYDSPMVRQKVTLNIRWGLPEDSEEAGPDPLPVELSARIYEVGESDDKLLSDNRLLAVDGGEAQTTFDQLVPIPGKEDKRVRQDRLELTLTPRYRSGRNLSLLLEVAGQVVT